MVVLLAGIALFGIGVFGSIRLNRHAFNRRNSAGVEEFPSYGAMIKTKFKEGAIGIFFGLCLLAGLALAFGGGIALTK